MPLSVPSLCPGLDIKLIRCCPDVLVWRHQGNDIVSVAAVCTAMIDFLCSGVPDLLCS